MDTAVIIPVFNGEKYLRRTLNSVASQTHAPQEIILVDDGSTDSSVDIVQEFSGVTLLHNPNKGANTARCWGIQHSTSDCIALLDQDDIWHPRHLAVLNQALEQHPNCSAAFGQCSFFSSEWERLFSTPVEKFQVFDPWLMFPTNSIPTPSAALIRRDALEKIGSWPAHLTGCADVYTWFRLGSDAPLVRSLAVTVAYRRHSQSMSMGLQSQRFQAYFDSFSTAMADAIRQRTATDPEQAKRLQQRLTALDIMPHILEAIERGESLALQNAILAFEASLAEDSESFISTFCNLLLFFIYPLLTQKLTLDHLLVSLSTSTSQTGKLLLQRIVASRVFLKQLAFHPFDQILWSALRQNQSMLQQKFRQYLSRF